MKEQQRDDKLDIMRAKFIRLPAITAIFLLILTISGCNALKRGDFLKQTDETLYFSKIGFSASDNSLVNPTLTSDVFLDIKGFNNNFLLNVPYSTDTTSNLVISFDLVGKDSIAEYWDTSIPDWEPLISGVTQLDFNEGNLPIQHQLRVGRRSPDSGAVTDFVYFYIDVDKTFYPVILNPHLPDVPAPLDLRIGFIDESGSIIPNMNLGIWNPGDFPQWDGWRMDLISAYPPPYRVANLPDYPEGFGVDAQPFYPENHELFFNEGIYSDQFGYKCRASEVSYYYDPPALHISKSGNDAAAGTKTDPIFSWGEAITRIQAFPDVYYNIKIEASESPYDVAPVNIISNALNPVSNTLSINGGYKPGFDGQYEGDWDSRPNTILINSAQFAGGGELSPSFVLQYDGVSNNFVMDKVQLEAASNTLFSSALCMVNNAQPLLSDVTLIASQGAGDSSGLTLINSSPIVRETRIIGKNGGSGKSVGIRMDNSNLQLESCFILSGDIADRAYGISASGAASSITTWGGAVLSGILKNDNYIETENFGIIASDTSLDLNNTWIHAKKSSLKSVAVQSSHPTNGHDTNILGSTFITDSSPSPIGLNITNTAVADNFHMYNSVILTDKSSSGSMGEALGINLQNMGFARISSNAIRIGTGDGANKTVGINLDGSAALELHNNLIWSHQASDFLGIRSNLNVDNVPIRNNDFWDTNGEAELELIPGSPGSIYNWQNASAGISGNISLHVGVDTTYSYDTNDLDVGRITGTLFDDVVYGGEDIMGLLPVNYDRDYRERTPDFGVGLSMGPFEYGNDGFLPREIYVSEATNGGDDNHPIGSRQNPFETIQQAYNYLSATDSLGMSTVRVSEGSYTTTAAMTLDKDFKLKGGFSPSFASRNTDTYPTIITTGAPMMFNIAGNNVTRAFLLEGFTLKTTNTGFYRIIETAASAKPVIRNNKILGGAGSDSEVVSIQDESNPRIEGNHIYGGTNTNSSVCIYSLDAGAEIINNVIHAGSAASTTSGIEFQDNDVSPDNNPVHIYNNTIFGGSGGIGSAGIRSYADNTQIVNNLINAGFVGSGVTYGIEISGSLTPQVINNNLILFGSPDPNRHAVSILGNIFDSVAGMESDLTLTYGRTSSGNLMDGTVDPVNYLDNFVPAMTAAGFLAENWHLTASGPENARYGGQNLSGYFNVDKDGITRTAPWSIGAYEY